MLSRRDLLVSAAAAAALIGRRTTAIAGGRLAAARRRCSSTCPPARATVTRTSSVTRARFPCAADRVYTPEPASIAEMRALHRALHMDRVVDRAAERLRHRQRLHARRRPSARLARQSRRRDRRHDAPASALDAMHTAGVRGIRINLATAGQTDAGRARRSATDEPSSSSRAARGTFRCTPTLAVIEAIRDQVAGVSRPDRVRSFRRRAGGARHRHSPASTRC